MAQVWRGSSAAGWSAEPVFGRYELSGEVSGEVSDEVAGEKLPAGVITQAGVAPVVGTPLSPAVDHVLVGAADRVRVNGEPLWLGICQLGDRDEILVREPGTGQCRRSYFTTEQLVTVETLPEGASGACPRCREALVVGHLAVRCPRCGVWHHEDPAANHPCWTYAERCAGCHDQLTALDAGFRWTPEDLSR